jgi:predicted ArsR family transcriptional regulator
MKPARWQKRLFRSTRGRILNLLRIRQHTVNELAATLKLTDNAVRAHLLKLERDGLVRQAGTQAGIRRPHVVYGLHPAADQIFPNPYGRLVPFLMSVLSRRVDPKSLRVAMRAIGKKVADGYAKTWKGKSRRQRIKTAIAVLHDLGGTASFEEEAHFIHADGCPIAAATANHPEACLIAESLLTRIIGRPVKEHCIRGMRPACRFRVN